MFNIVIHLYILVYCNMPPWFRALSTETADYWLNKLAFYVQWKRYERGFQLETLSWTRLMFVSSSWCLALHAHHKLKEHRNENHCQDQQASALPENMQERWKKWQNKTVQTVLQSCYCNHASPINQYTMSSCSHRDDGVVCTVCCPYSSVIWTCLPDFLQGQSDWCLSYPVVAWLCIPNTCNIQWTLLIKNRQNTAHWSKTVSPLTGQKAGQT